MGRGTATLLTLVVALSVAAPALATGGALAVDATATTGTRLEGSTAVTAATSGSSHVQITGTDPSPPSPCRDTTFTADETDRNLDSYTWEWYVDGELVDSYEDGAPTRTTLPTSGFEVGTEIRVEVVARDPNGTVIGNDTRSYVLDDCQPGVTVDASDPNPDLGETVTLSANATDPDGGSTTIEWNVDGEYRSAWDDQATVEVSYDAYGDHLFEAVVTDDEDDTASDRVAVLWNDPPTIDSWGWSPTQPNTSETVAFTATANDSKTAVRGYDWAFGDGDGGSGPAPSHSYGTAGNSTVVLTVTDDDGKSTTASRTIEVNGPPTASLVTYSPDDPAPGTDVTFGVDAADPDGDDLDYAWDVDGDDEVETTGAAPTHAYDSAGEYEVAVTVTDDNGQSDAATTTVTVERDTDPPEVTDLLVDPEPPVEGRPVGFLAEATDPDGDDGALQYDWEFGDGTVTEGAGPLVNHTYASRGQLVLTLTVTDEDGATTTVERTVEVNAPPEASLAVFPDPPVAGEETRFVANGSDPDGDDGALQYDWAFGDGTVAEAAGPDVTHTFGAAGDYEVSLTLTDGEGTTTTTTRTVVVAEPNGPPAVSIDVSPGSPAAGEPVEFTAEASDPDGSVESYEWTVDGDPAGSGETVEYTFDTVGDHTVQVVVTDDTGDTTSESVTVTVGPDNDPPSVSVDYEPATPETGQSVEFTAEASDPDGSVESYGWSVDGEPAGSGATFSRAFGAAGDHEVAVTVTDDEGATTTANATVSVAGASGTPSVSLSHEPTGPAPGEPVEFTADASDPDDDSLEYVWTFGNGTTESGVSLARPTHTYDTAGTRTVRVTVTDDDGNAATDTVTVAVNDPPSVSIAYDPTGPVAGETVAFSADASDSDGSVEAYEWTVDGEGVSAGERLNYTFEEPGDHEVTLAVVDDGGARASTTVSVPVSPGADRIGYDADPVAGEAVTFEATGVDEGTVASYEWVVDGEVVGDGPEFSYTFQEPGEREVALRVLEEDGAESTFRTTVVVDAADGTGSDATDGGDGGDGDAAGDGDGGNGDGGDGILANPLVLFGIPAGLLVLALLGYGYVSARGSSTDDDPLGSGLDEGDAGIARDTDRGAGAGSDEPLEGIAKHVLDDEGSETGGTGDGQTAGDDGETPWAAVRDATTTDDDAGDPETGTGADGSRSDASSSQSDSRGSPSDPDSSPSGADGSPSDTDISSSGPGESTSGADGSGDDSQERGAGGATGGTAAGGAAGGTAPDGERAGTSTGDDRTGGTGDGETGTAAGGAAGGTAAGGAASGTAEESSGPTWCSSSDDPAEEDSPTTGDDDSPHAGDE